MGGRPSSGNHSQLRGCDRQLRQVRTHLLLLLTSPVRLLRHNGPRNPRVPTRAAAKDRDQSGMLTSTRNSRPSTTSPSTMNFKHPMSPWAAGRTRTQVCEVSYAGFTRGGVEFFFFCAVRLPHDNFSPPTSAPLLLSLLRLGPGRQRPPQSPMFSCTLCSFPFIYGINFGVRTNRRSVLTVDDTLFSTRGERGGQVWDRERGT